MTGDVPGPDRAEGAADFVRRFADYWSAPTPDRLDMVLADPVRLIAPMTPATTSLEAGKGAFRRLLELIPDLTADVHRWGATDDGVLIEFTLNGTLAGSPISWTAVDRFVLDEEGLASERITYFDSAPLAFTVARRPRAWPGFIRAQLASRSR